MDRRRQDRVAVVALPPAGARALEPFLRRAGLEVAKPPTAEAAIDLLHETPYRLVLAGHPMPGLSVPAFVTVLRSGSSASRDAGLLVVTEAPPPPDILGLVGRGINTVLQASASPETIQGAAATLLEVAPRAAIRALVKVRVTVGSGASAILAQTENVSSSGMLVRSGRHPEPGTVLPVELSLPGDPAPVRCRGEVVRHADRSREGVEGFAVRFIGLGAADRLRLERAVRRAAEEESP